MTCHTAAMWNKLRSRPAPSSLLSLELACPCGWSLPTRSVDFVTRSSPGRAARSVSDGLDPTSTCSLLHCRFHAPRARVVEALKDGGGASDREAGAEAVSAGAAALELGAIRRNPDGAPAAAAAGAFLVTEVGTEGVTPLPAEAVAPRLPTSPSLSLPARRCAYSARRVSTS